MAVGTRIDSNAGVNTSNNTTGTQIGRDVSNTGFAPFPVDSSGLKTAAATLTAVDCGLTVLSGTSGVVALVMPLASAVPGGIFIFRNASADSHTLSGSQEANGIKVFDLASGSNGSLAGGVSGSKVTFPAIVGSTIIMQSTGISYLVSRVSGTFTVNGT